MKIINRINENTEVTLEKNSFSQGLFRWITQEIYGESVITEGDHSKLPLILDREGYQVLNLVQDHIDLPISEDMPSNISSEKGSILTIDLKSRTFDTAVLINVINNIGQQERLFQRVWDLLNREGKIVVITPLLEPRPDQAQSNIQLTTIMSNMYPYFNLSEIKIVGESFCFSAHKREKVIHGALTNVDLQVLAEAEKEFQQTKLSYLTELEHKEETIRQLTAQLDKEKITGKDIRKELYEHVKAFENEEVRKRLEIEIEHLKTEHSILEKSFKEYASRASVALSDRDKNLKYLINRLTVIQQSTKYKIMSLFTDALKKPWLIPINSYRVMRTIGGGVKRKIKRKKRTYRLINLPYKLSPIPRSPYGDVSSKFLTGVAELSLNPLYLTGLYASPSSIKQLRVAAILDDFSYQSFKHDCKLITFRPDNWREVFSYEHPNLLLVESAWKGNGGSWQYKIGKYNIAQANELNDILAYCKQKNIATVFWNKEDPIHYDKFIDTAKKFDVIFTTDEMCIPKYKEACGHDKVYSLPFAAQPQLHNPIKSSGYKEKSVCFAGSYYANRHEDRKKDQEELLDAAREYDLEIYDRNYFPDGKQNEHFMYPERFQKHVIGSKPYSELVREYKRYKVFLNVNSVQESKTMFSRRVFELLGCGTTVVSTYSKGIETMFEGIVPIVKSEAEAKEQIQKALFNANWRTKNEIIGMREVFEKHTYAERLYEIATKSGISVDKPYQFKVHVISVVKTKSDAEKVLEMVKLQEMKELSLTIFYFVLDDEQNIHELQEEENVDIIYVKNVKDIDDHMGEKVNEFDYISLFTPNNYYGPNFLKDLVHAVIYTDCEVIGKRAYFYYDETKNEILSKDVEKDYTFTNSVRVDACLINAAVFKKHDFTISNLVNNEETLANLFNYGLKMFSIHPYNFVSNVEQLPDTEKENVLQKIVI
ncbi:glycosyltransferase [Alkalihalobacillus sp. BA299]|uniref:glycosyltransferase family protein n=1 Tax=Alkalihalobacillus sp. BA299 TaxID=2815938 RepID=UPI001ADA8A35|nr:glycosyltransferase [Alkalihalobacillus sp. BA299]